MGLFKGKLAAAFDNTVKTVVSGISNLGSGIAQGVVAPVLGAAGSLLKDVTPMVKDIANSGMGVAFGAGASTAIGGKPMSADGLSALMDGVNSGNRTSSKSNSGDGLTTPLTGLSKFFCYYKMTDEGMLDLTSGSKELNWVKISIHSAGVGVIAWVVWKTFFSRKGWR